MRTRGMTRRQQSTEEDREAAETLILLSKGHVPPLSHLPVAVILSETLYESCCLIGCNLSVKKPLKYCSIDHKDMAKIMSSSHDLPVTCFGDFTSTYQRDTICGGLLLTKSNKIQTGVPVLKLPQLFSTMPLDLQFIKNNPPAASSSWIFFHSTPSLHEDQHGSKWVKEKGKREFQIGSSSISSTDLCLLDPTAESWTLYLYQNAKESLYCLSHVSGMIPQSKMNPDSEKSQNTRIDTKIKLRKEGGKWSINNEKVPTAFQGDVVEAEDQKFQDDVVEAEDQNTQNRASVHK